MSYLLQLARVCLVYVIGFVYMINALGKQSQKLESGLKYKLCFMDKCIHC